MWALLIGVSLVLSLNSCSKDPVIPEDETKNKLHEDPAKMTVRLVECHLHADWNEIQKAGGPHQNPESPARYMKRVQEITYELKTGSGWTLAEGSQGKFYVQKNGEYKNGNNFTPAPVYLMFIYYYNSKGELMNGQFVENGQENIHQHFFTPENVRPTFDGKPEADDNDPEALVDYLYVDTTPWDKTKHDNEAEITGGTNPVGLKGVIRFLKDRKEFDLKLRLYHGYNSKKNPQTNGFDPFYKPSGVLIQRGTWDINLSIPVVVFWSREEFVDVDPEADVNLIGRGQAVVPVVEGVLDGLRRAGREVCALGPLQQRGSRDHRLERAAGNAGAPAQAGRKGVGGAGDGERRVLVKVAGVQAASVGLGGGVRQGAVGRGCRCRRAVRCSGRSAGRLLAGGRCAGTCREQAAQQHCAQCQSQRTDIFQFHKSILRWSCPGGGPELQE